MNKKIIFIDVDGTLVGFNESGLFIPESAIRAIRQARQNGHLVYLCTGRGMAEIDDSLTSIGLDGIIGAAGGFIIENDKKIYHKRMPKEAVQEIMNYFDSNEVAYYLESNSGLYNNSIMYNLMKNDPIQEPFLDMMKMVEDADLEDINKISFISFKLSFEQVLEHFQDTYNLVKASWTDPSIVAGEISIKGVTKGSAIEFLLNHLHMTKEDAMAFGDSMNDREMFGSVHTAIVMGNSMHGIKELADYETKPLEEDGIEYAMKHFHLI